MNRITFSKENGDWGIEGIDLTELSPKLYGAVMKLKKYEDTRLDPYEVEDKLSVEPTNECDDVWIPVDPDDKDSFPKNDDYIMVSFKNFDLPDIARYEEDEDGGAFYPGDEDKSYSSFGLFVNAWRPLPAPYREELMAKKRITNAERIRAMTDEELAEFLLKVNVASEPCMTDEGNCKWEDYPTHDKGCKDCFLEWLKSEVKE